LRGWEYAARFTALLLPSVLGKQEEELTPADQIVPMRVSILARLIPAISYALPAFGAACSAWLFINVMQAMRNAESAGIAAVAGGMSGANLAVVITLYLAIFVGLVGVIVGVVRAFSTTTTASPSGWWILVMGLLGFSSMLTLWRAESLLLNVLTVRSGPGIVSVADQISTCLMLTIGLAAVGCVVLLVASVVPLPAFLRAKRKWAPVIFLVVMELGLVVMTIAYHVRAYWFYQARINERF
jgi:hypothetical protein